MMNIFKFILSIFVEFRIFIFILIKTITLRIMEKLIEFVTIIIY